MPTKATLTDGVERVASSTLAHGLIVCARGSVVRYGGSAIVNAANEGCLGGGGVDGAISSAGGRALLEARQKLPLIKKAGNRGQVRCPTGDAKTTIAGDLGCDWVIHAVGPNYRMYSSEGEGDALLYRAYRASMLESQRKQLPDLAFSLLSAGIFRGRRSLRDVLGIGLLAVSAATYDGLTAAVFVGFTAEEVDTLTSLLGELFPPDDATARAAAAERLLGGLSDKVRALHAQALHAQALDGADASSERLETPGAPPDAPAATAATARLLSGAAAAAMRDGLAALNISDPHPVL